MRLHTRDRERGSGALERHRTLGIVLLAAALSACGSQGGTDTGQQPDVADTGAADARADAASDVPADLATDVTPDAPCPGATACGGECVDTRTDVHHCGSCALDCTALAGVDRAGVRCAEGRCVVSGACAALRADCDGVPDNGCEALLSTTANCGGCGVACGAPRPLCAMGAGPTGGYGCSAGCTTDAMTRCGDTCVDLRSDPHNCNACGVACASPEGGTGACVGARCVPTCPPGRHLCGERCVDDAAVATCGAACSPCPTIDHAAATCDGTRCGLRCDAGYHACGGACVPEGAPTACGASCVVCPGRANASTTCEAGACAFACAPGFADCDHVADNGCEADLRTSANCGGCGVMCGSAAPFCAPSGATLACATLCTGAADAFCAGACADLATDARNCGACGTTCAAPGNARPLCVARACTFECDAGYHRCGDACVSNTDVATCGASCTPCPTPAGASATCDGTSCGSACPAGQHLCGAACVSNNTTATCGLRCTPCAADPVGTVGCDGAECTLSCPPGYVRGAAGCVDTDECALTPGLCGFGTCNNLPGAYACACDPGYVAPAQGGTCVATGYCNAHPGLCGANSACWDDGTLYDFLCSCSAGYWPWGLGGACINVDECTEFGGVCGAGATGCTDTPGSYVCTCADGYVAPPEGGSCVPTPTVPAYGVVSSTAPFVNACAQSAHTELFPVGTDDATTQAAIPFGFVFYGSSYASVTVSSNGTLQFASASDTWENGCLPDARFNDAIFAFWDDLLLAANDAAVCAATVGTAPNRQLVVTWNNAQHFPGELGQQSAYGSFTFSVVLSEGTNQIDVVYQTLSGLQTATIGVQHDTGSASTVAGCYTSLRAPSAIGFIPF